MARRSIWAPGGTMVELRPWLWRWPGLPSRSGGAGGAAVGRDRRAVAARHGAVAERHQPRPRAGIQGARRQGGRALDQLPRRLPGAVGIDCGADSRAGRRQAAGGRVHRGRRRVGRLLAGAGRGRDLRRRQLDRRQHRRGPCELRLHRGDRATRHRAAPVHGRGEEGDARPVSAARP